MPSAEQEHLELAAMLLHDVLLVQQDEDDNASAPNRWSSTRIRNSAAALITLDPDRDRSHFEG